MCFVMHATGLLGIGLDFRFPFDIFEKFHVEGTLVFLLAVLYCFSRALCRDAIMLSLVIGPRGSHFDIVFR